MKEVQLIRGRGVPLDRTDVDTDQIIPAVWMMRVDRTGFEDGLFQQWRKDPDFVLNRPEYHGGKILVAGANFGCGSSREHAPWALRDYGFEAVVSSRFADIFRNNLPNAGLVPAQVSEATVTALMGAVTEDPSAEITLDVVGRQISCSAAGVHEEPFFLDDSAHYRLVRGLDAIDLTMALEDKIAALEQRQPPWMPHTWRQAAV